MHGKKGSPKSHRCRTVAPSHDTDVARAISSDRPQSRRSEAPPVAAPEAADDEWVRCHDAATGASYYANRRSFEVSWTPPPAVAASAPAPPPVVVTAKASVAAPPPARARRAADAAWIGRGGAALAKATREAPTPVVAPPPPAPEPPSPPPPPTPETPPTPEPDDEPSYEEEFVVVDERTDSGTEGSGASPGVRGDRGGGRGAGAQRPADAQGCHAGACRRAFGCAADARITADRARALALAAGARARVRGAARPPGGRRRRALAALAEVPRRLAPRGGVCARSQEARAPGRARRAGRGGAAARSSRRRGGVKPGHDPSCV